MALPPPKRSEMGAFYVVFGPMELSAGLGYTTSNCSYPDTGPTLDGTAYRMSKPRRAASVTASVRLAAPSLSRIADT